jgi:dolichol-phosphate mannosyltransferase
LKIFFVLPAYNEEQQLPNVLEGFQRDVAAQGYDVRVVIVDDGSSDGTRDVAKRWSALLPVELIVHPVNLGLGETIRDGLKHAAEIAEPGDAIVSMDADNTQPTALIPSMLVSARSAGS